MRCGAARKSLYLNNKESSVGSAPPQEVAEARTHVADCAACQQFFASEERLGRLVKTQASRAIASAALREKVLAGIAGERARSTSPYSTRAPVLRRPLTRALAALMLVGAAAGGIYVVQQRNQVSSQPLTVILIEDHLGNLSRSTEIAASDPVAVQQWFQARVGFSFRLPATSEPQLIGGRRCNLQGRKAALIWYRHPQSTVSLFIVDAGDVEFAENQLITLDGKRCLLDARKGFNVVLWKERGLVYGLVSDVRSAELLQLAAKF